MSDAERMAEEHWAWLEGLLEYWPNIGMAKGIICYLYKTAFIHGYKHGRSDND